MADDAVVAVTSFAHLSAWANPSCRNIESRIWSIALFLISPATLNLSMQRPTSRESPAIVGGGTAL